MSVLQPKVGNPLVIMAHGPLQLLLEPLSTTYTEDPSMKNTALEGKDKDCCGQPLSGSIKASSDRD